MKRLEFPRKRKAHRKIETGYNDYMAKLKDEQGDILVVYHGTNVDTAELDHARTIDGGLHFGTLAQASMRNSRRIFSAQLDIHKAQRCRDLGGNWKESIRRAKARGADAIVYLNRYEGIPFERVEHAYQNNIDLDKLTDKEFSRLIPEAQDSWIVFDTSQVNILGIQDSPRKKPKP